MIQAPSGEQKAANVIRGEEDGFRCRRRLTPDGIKDAGRSIQSSMGHFYAASQHSWICSAAGRRCSRSPGGSQPGLEWCCVFQLRSWESEALDQSSRIPLLQLHQSLLRGSSLHFWSQALRLLLLPSGWFLLASFTVQQPNSAGFAGCSGGTGASLAAPCGCGSVRCHAVVPSCRAIDYRRQQWLPRATSRLLGSR